MSNSTLITIDHDTSIKIELHKLKLKPFSPSIFAPKSLMKPLYRFGLYTRLRNNIAQQHLHYNILLHRVLLTHKAILHQYMTYTSVHYILISRSVAFNQPETDSALFCPCKYIFQTHVWCREFNTLRPRQNGIHFADDMFKCIFWNENVWIPIEISLKFVPKGSINNNPALFQMMAWRRPGDKPLSEPMMVSSLTHICVTRPQLVKTAWQLSNYFLRHPFLDDYRYVHQIKRMEFNAKFSVIGIDYSAISYQLISCKHRPLVFIFDKTIDTG